MSVHSDGEGTGSIFTMDIPLSDSSFSVHTTPERKQFTRENPIIDSSDYDYEARSPSSVHPLDDSLTEEIQRKCPTIVERPCTSSLRVLVVDDVSLNRKMLIRSISSSFRHIAEACNGSEAVQYVIDSKHKPDIILIDFHMPKMDGPTATRELRALGYKGMIIGVTGSALPADMEIFLSAGATCVLTKPYHVEDLFAAIAGTKIYTLINCIS